MTMNKSLDEFNNSSIWIHAKISTVIKACGWSALLSHHKQTTPEFRWCFHTSQTDHTKLGDTSLTELNQTGSAWPLSWKKKALVWVVLLEQALTNSLFWGKVAGHAAAVSNSFTSGQNILHWPPELQPRSPLLRATASAENINPLHLEIPHSSLSFLHTFRLSHLESSPKWDREDGKKRDPRGRKNNGVRGRMLML